MRGISRVLIGLTILSASVPACAQQYYMRTKLPGNAAAAFVKPDSTKYYCTTQSGNTIDGAYNNSNINLAGYVNVSSADQALAYCNSFTIDPTHPYGGCQYYVDYGSVAMFQSDKPLRILANTFSSSSQNSIVSLCS